MPTKNKKNDFSPDFEMRKLFDNSGMHKLFDNSGMHKLFDNSGMHKLFDNSGMHKLFDGCPFTWLTEESSSLDSKLDPKSTAKDVAGWMLKEVKAKKTLYQRDAVEHIEKHFGKRFIYANENNNPAISRQVLKEFERISPKTVVWNRREFFWRIRQPSDPISRMVDD